MSFQHFNQPAHLDSETTDPQPITQPENPVNLSVGIDPKKHPEIPILDPYDDLDLTESRIDDDLYPRTAGLLIAKNETEYNNLRACVIELIQRTNALLQYGGIATRAMGIVMAGVHRLTNPTFIQDLDSNIVLSFAYTTANERYGIHIWKPSELENYKDTHIRELSNNSLAIYAIGQGAIYKLRAVKTTPRFNNKTKNYESGDTVFALCEGRDIISLHWLPEAIRSELMKIKSSHNLGNNYSIPVNEISEAILEDIANQRT